MKELLRRIPKVDEVLKSPEWAELVGAFPEGLAKDVLRGFFDRLREGIKRGEVASIPPVEAIVKEVREEVARLGSPGLRRVINGTGVIIHTNLGRSLLAPQAVEAIVSAAEHYINLEYDLTKGARGDRYEHCTSLLKRLTGCESALVVNNNAGAVFLALNTLAEGKEVIISRGELVEIGGSFRIPDVMKKSGAVLREVGTTNRTYKDDFERVINEETAMLMKAHPSNFRVKGFVHEMEVEDLVALGTRYNIPTYYDAGSGLLFHLDEIGIHDEPLVIETLAKGLDVISFSGDKLPGAPQAGIILGKAPYVEAMKRNPLARALRADKFTLAGLESTLLLYLDVKKAKEEIPTLRMLYEDRAVLKRRAARLARMIQDRGCPCTLSVVEVASEVGGGTLPDVPVPSYAVAMKPLKMGATHLEERLRGLEIPIIARIEKDRILIDVRTILKSDEAPLVTGIEAALADG